MKVVVRFSVKQEKLALPIILRDQPGMVLPERTYILAESTVEKLARAGVEFAEISRESATDAGACIGERI